MIGQNKYLTQFRDMNGEIPQLGDQVMYPAWRHVTRGYIDGIILKNITKGESYMYPEIKITDEMGNRWGQNLTKSMFNNCIILKENKQTVPWQYNK